jgi:hypothetical protein
LEAGRECPNVIKPKLWYKNSVTLDECKGRRTPQRGKHPGDSKRVAIRPIRRDLKKSDGGQSFDPWCWSIAS